MTWRKQGSGENTGRLVLLDAGGVVLDGLATINVAKKVAVATGADPAQVLSFFYEQLNPLASTGERSESWVFEQLSARFGNIDVVELAAVARKSTLPLPNVAGVLERLSQQVPLWMLSNYVAPWLRDALIHRQLDQYFERLFISSETGMRKPDIAAFMEVIAVYGGAPEEIIFVDDKQENLEAATHSGVHAVLSNGNSSTWETDLIVWLNTEAK